jgi:predicted phosphodiesterase
MKVLILGDVHGFWTEMNVTIAHAIGTHPDITHIVQVGDFGYGWTSIPGFKPFKASRGYFSDEELAIYEAAEKLWLDGNHENHDKLDNDGGAWQPDWKHMPRGSVLEVDGYRMLFFGGGSSVDRSDRISHVSWWPQENITYGQVQACLESVDGPIDALFSHDHAECVPYSDSRYKSEDPPSKGNREMLQVLVDHFQPDYHFFGHHHAPDRGNVKGMEWVCCPIIEMPKAYTIWTGTSVFTYGW